MNEKKVERSGFLKEIIGSLTSPKTTFKSILKNEYLVLKNKKNSKI